MARPYSCCGNRRRDFECHRLVDARHGASLQPLWGLFLGLLEAEDVAVELCDAVVEDVVVEFAVKVVEGLLSQSLASLPVVDEALDGRCEAESVAGFDEKRVVPVFHILLLCAVVGADMRLSLHHIFQVGQSHGLGLHRRQHTEIALCDEVRHVLSESQQRDIAHQFVGHDEPFELRHIFWIAIADDGEVILVAVELCDGLQSDVDALLGSQAPVIHD